MFGEAQHHLRSLLWDSLQQLLKPYSTFLIIGDINQVEQYSDKLGESSLIRGWEDVVSWRHNMNLQDIPFSGPRYAWCSNRENDIVLERLDRAYATIDWMIKFPQTCIQNLPIVHSDHAYLLANDGHNLDSAETLSN